ncbi:creatininase family protein [Caenimonas terrae]|uniref:Creatininase family protein n=1 Tax=Caenimonas terrae TaxID=696074 RepID=A0ABW0NMP6_9BURK
MNLTFLRRSAAAALLAALTLAQPLAALAAPGVLLEDMTWTEVRDVVQAGHTTIIIPVGGTEQSGPHMALGKHNFRAAALSARIAAKLGNALVAPVLAYVPEGRITPPAGHMRFPGTISVPDDAFAGILAGAARSFRQAGFLDIVLLGDHGGYQGQLRDLAQRLNREWAGSRAHVHYIGAYYQAASDGFNQALRAKGLTDAQIGVHAGAADTALMLAVDPAKVRADRMQSSGGEAATGIVGDPSRASAALGTIGIDMTVERTVEAIRQAVKTH